MRGFDALGYDRAAVTDALATFISGFFEKYAAAQGKPRWADKTPDYVECLPELWELFGPTARFLLIYRHGMDVAYSLADPHRRYPAIREHVARMNGDVPVAAATYWAETVERMEAFRTAHLDACHVIRYEELTATPEAVVRAALEFLGEPWEPEVLEYDRFTHHDGLEDPDVRRRRRIETNSGRYRAWPDEVQRAVREACAPGLAALQYG